MRWLAITAFIVPYIFILNPALLFIDTGPLQVIQIVITSFIGMFGLAAGIEGYMLRKIAPLWRLAAISGGLLLIDPGLLSDLCGIGLIAAVVAAQIVGDRKRH